MLPMDDIQAFRTGLAKDRARSPKRHTRLSSWTYGSRIRSISDASEDSLQGLRRGDLRKNSWVHILPGSPLPLARVQRLRAAPVRQQRSY